jgi:hypothetical protein
MTEDFVTRLERQLTSAERLQERGGRLSRLIAPVRAWRPSPVAGLGLAAAAAALIAAVVLIRGSDEPTPVGHSPSVVARTWLPPEATNECTVAPCDFADPFMGLAAGYGSAWVGSVQHGDVLRLDARSHRVVKRIPVGRLPSDVVAAAGAVWVVVNPNERSSTLVRIDPATNRVTDRFPVPSVMLKPRLLGDDRALWLVGDERGVRFDPRRGVVAGSVRWGFRGGVYAKGFGLGGDDFWARAEDGQMLRFGAHTGAREGRAESPPGVANLAVIGGAGVVVGNTGGTVTRINASDGRALWSTRVATLHGSGVGSARPGGTIAIAGDAAWVLIRDESRATERLGAVDLATGRMLSSTRMPNLGGAWMQPVGDELWYVAEGYAVVVRP